MSYLGLIGIVGSTEEHRILNFIVPRVGCTPGVVSPAGLLAPFVISQVVVVSVFGGGVRVCVVVSGFVLHAFPVPVGFPVGGFAQIGAQAAYNLMA